ncbi:hypothetical protein FRC01_014546, partial [Tulasnella sp. 417]
MSLDRYISDNAIKFFGLSDDSIVNYVKAAASSAKSPEGLFHALTSHGLPNTPEAQNFVTEVYSQAPRKHKAKKAADTHHKVESNKDLLAKKFSLLLDDDPGAVEVRSKSKGKSKATASSEKERETDRSSKKERKERHTRKRETDANAWESDEEEKAYKRR